MMKNRIKGCTHHESKVVSKFARGGMAGSANTKAARDSVAGPSRDAGGRNVSSASRPSSGGGGFTGSGNGGGYARNNKAAREAVGPGARPPAGTGLTTGKTWSGNTAYGPAGGRAAGFANNAAEARAKMATPRTTAVGARVVPTAGPAPVQRPTTLRPKPVQTPSAQRPTTLRPKPNAPMTYGEAGAETRSLKLNPEPRVFKQSPSVASTMSYRLGVQSGTMDGGGSEVMPIAGGKGHKQPKDQARVPKGK